MTTLEAIRAELVAATSVTDAIAEHEDQPAIFPVVIPQDCVTTDPVVVLSVISESPVNSFDGSPDTRLLQALVQCDVFARGYIEAHAAADAINAVLAALSRSDLACSLDVRRDFYDDETRLHRCSMDFDVSR